MQNWVKFFIMICFQRVVNGTRADNIIVIIMEALQNGGGLNSAIVIKKFFVMGLMG
jgi:hypothetical protein